MNTLTKTFVLLQLVLALVLSVLVILFADKQQNYRSQVATSQKAQIVAQAMTSQLQQGHVWNFASISLRKIIWLHPGHANQSPSGTFTCLRAGAKFREVFTCVDACCAIVICVMLLSLCHPLPFKHCPSDGNYEPPTMPDNHTPRTGGVHLLAMIRLSTLQGNSFFSIH